MKFSLSRFHRPARSKLMSAASALLAVAGIVGTTAGSVHATQVVAAPLAPPRIIGTVFTGDTSANIILAPNSAPTGVKIEAEKVSGPGTQTILIVRSDVFINGVAPSTAYVFRVRRNQFFDVARNRPTNIVSAWVTVSVNTPPLFAGERPGAPVINLVGVNNGRVTINITAPPATSTTPQASFRYTYRLNGGPELAVCSGGAYTCLTAAELTTVDIALPAPGTSVQVTVQAVDNNGYSGATSNALVVSN